MAGIKFNFQLDLTLVAHGSCFYEFHFPSSDVSLEQADTHGEVWPASEHTLCSYIFLMYHEIDFLASI